MSWWLLKAAALACVAFGFGLLAQCSLARRDSLLQRALRQHIARLNAMAARCFAPANGGRTVRIQAALSIAVVALAVLVGIHPLFTLAALAVIGVSPYVELIQKRRQRLARIEEATASFGMALANSLRSSGNVGRALERTRSVVPEALADELLVLQQEIQLGVSVDEALRSLGERVGSVTFDLMLSGILIGRQIGGNLPEILETNSSSIREMARIQGVIRSKTAESKGQLWVLGLAPPVIFVAFDTLQPGYFEPLMAGTTGPLLLLLAGLLWLGAMIAAKKILMVDV
ncbi:MAG TPA: type II secretion system F family protein [Polyangiaceae bacterium]|nr:type II secretion system F family protein [Polyangiaceae bacterium]